MSGAPEVLIVDDDRDDARFVELALQHTGSDCQSRWFGGGRELLEHLDGQAANGKPALILLDLNMPRLSGLETLAALRQRFGLDDLPVVVLSTSESERDVISAYARGANAYIVKPLLFKELVEAIRGLCGFFSRLDQPPPQPTHC